MVDLHVKKMLEEDLYNFLPEASSFSILAERDPISGDRIIVTTDDTHEDKRTMYAYENSQWVYLGVVSEMPVELIITKDRNLYISDKDRKPMLVTDVLCYKTYAELLSKNPAIENKLYLVIGTSELFFYDSNKYKKISGGGTSGDSSGLIFNTISELNTFLTNESRLSGALATCIETEGILYILSTDRASWLPVNQGGGTIAYLINSEIW
jgi:hypothetical protein